MTVGLRWGSALRMKHQHQVKDDLVQIEQESRLLYRPAKHRGPLTSSIQGAALFEPVPMSMVALK